MLKKTDAKRLTYRGSNGELQTRIASHPSATKLILEEHFQFSNQTRFRAH